MNKVVLMGRLTRDPEVRYSTGENAQAIARYTLAVDRRFARRDNPNAQTADFISCVAFGKSAEFAEKYFRQGSRITVSGRIQTGSYTDRDGRKVYTTDVVIEEQEFAESKNSASEQHGQQRPAQQKQDQPAAAAQSKPSNSEDDFMNIPDSDYEGLPFED